MADAVQDYAKTMGLVVKERTVLVEGATDVNLIHLAARLELASSGQDILDGGLCFACPGIGDRGGVDGVVRELGHFRAFSKICLSPTGTPKYRFVGLLDNDAAGRGARGFAQRLDSSILEFKDLFRLWPVMPLTGNLDPQALGALFAAQNDAFRGLDWEIEDLLPETFVELALSEHQGQIRKKVVLAGKVHWELTQDGKSKVHRFAQENAMLRDLDQVVSLVRAMRFYLRLPN